MDSQNGVTQFGQSRRNPKDSVSKRTLFWRGLGLALLLAFATLVVWEIRQLDMRMAQVSQQFERVQERSDQALQRASEAETSAKEAARQRDQAEVAEAQSQKAAQLAQQQATAAQTEAAQAQQKAEQYRQQREAELTRLQQALSQIAETHRTAMGLIMTLDNNSVRFDFDQATLKPQYREVLSKVAGVLMTLRGYHISVYGYTDDIGTEAYNLALSERRAATVRDYLVKAGVDPSIITTTKGYGKADPRAPGDTPQARAMNRRVEIGIVASSLHYPVPGTDQ